MEPRRTQLKYLEPSYMVQGRWRLLPTTSRTRWQKAGTRERNSGCIRGNSSRDGWRTCTSTQPYATVRGEQRHRAETKECNRHKTLEGSAVSDRPELSEISSPYAMDQGRAGQHQSQRPVRTAQGGAYAGMSRRQSCTVACHKTATTGTSSPCENRKEPDRSQGSMPRNPERASSPQRHGHVRGR